MAIHYDSKAKRFRDERGRMVSKARAMRSSVARREFNAAQLKPKPKHKPSIQPKVSHAKPKTKRPLTRAAPWEKEGIVREYPAPYEWLPEVDDYDYDDLEAEWGDYDDEETDS